MPTIEYKFKVGQLVTVRNWGKSYPRYTDWFYDNNVKYLRDKFEYAYFETHTYPPKTLVFRVVARGTSRASSKTIIYAIQVTEKNKNMCDGQVFLVGECGLEKCSGAEVII